MSDENDNGRPQSGRTPLTLKPRAGSVSSGVVKQSFSHGRSKTVVVETKRSRPHGPGTGGNLAGPSAAEKRATFEPRPSAPSAPRGPAAAASSTDGLSAEEAARRQRAIELAQERQAAERRAREEEQRRREAERRAAAEAAAPAPAPAPAAPEQPAAPAARAPEAPAAPPRAAAAAPGQTRTYEPSRERRDDRPSTTTYRPERPAFNQRAPRADADRAGGYQNRGPREDSGAERGDRAPRGAGRPGETVRYSALNPRPAPRTGDRPGGPRGARPGVGEAAPATPEIQRATRQAPRPGSANLDRRPAEDEDDRRKGAGPGKAVSRTKGEPKRREGRLTIQALAGDDEGAAERMRSLASVRRAREREREKRKGGGVEQAKVAREVVIPDVITVQELANRMATRGVEVIKFLMRQGVMLKINDVIDNDTAEL
ncbi:MAG TPA: translation initiation factor IF-2 N-terminal domain-containing protein, partial [Caulobacteraceae bacterium]